MTREELKTMFLNMAPSTIERKEIIVGKCENPHWPGYGDVEILREGPDGYSHFSTHQEHPLQYAKDRMSQDKYKEYKLIVNE